MEGIGLFILGVICLEIALMLFASIGYKPFSDKWVKSLMQANMLFGGVLLLIMGFMSMIVYFLI